MKRWAALALALALAAGGCTWKETKRNLVSAKNTIFDTGATTTRLYEEDETPIIELDYTAGEELSKVLVKAVPLNSPVAYERFNNGADPADKAPFGRVVAAQVAARMAQLGHPMVAGAPRPLPPKPVPEQNATESGSWFQGSKEPDPRPCVLSGTYTLGDSVIYLHARVATVDNDTEVSGYDWTLPINKNTRELLPQLRKGGMTPTVKTQF